MSTQSTLPSPKQGSDHAFKQAFRKNQNFLSFFIFKIQANKKFTTITLFLLFFTLLFTTTANAAPIQVNPTNYQGYRGVYMKPYFEAANLSSSSTPVANTATSLSGATGFSVIPHGSSAYLYSPQFTIATSIPTGPLTVNLWAASTPALDGSNSSSFSASSGSITLTTSQPYDIIYVTVTVRSSSVTVNTPTATGLTFTARGAATSTGYGKIWAFYAKTSTTAFSGRISVTLSSSNRFVLTGFGISGANTSNPFDPNVSTLASANGNNNTPSVTINPSQKNDFIIGAAFIYCSIFSNPTATAGSGFTIIANTAIANYLRGVSEYKNWANSGSQQVRFTLSSSQRWAIIADAIVPALATVNISAKITDSSGSIQATLVNDETANFSSVDPQIIKVFQIGACTVPAFGYVKIELRAPYSSPIRIFWGNVSSTNYVNSTNFQIVYAFN